MMLKKHFYLLLFLLSSACATTHVIGPENILGIRPGMRESAARAQLQSVGDLARKEAKRQEVWTLHDDPRFRALIVGFDAENHVRFVTAVAKPDGQRMRFADVADATKAEKGAAGATQTWVWRDPRQRYIVVAIGNDPEYLTYLSLKRLGEREDEEEEG